HPDPHYWRGAHSLGSLCQTEPYILGPKGSSMSTISLQNVAKFYGSARAVEDISLDIAQGEFLALLGPSGCGKTTTLRMIAGFIEASNGRILFDDRDVTRLPPNRRNTGMVFQGFALFPHMTVFENVAYGLQMRKVGKEEI